MRGKNENEIEYAVRLLGGASAAARIADVTPRAVGKWMKAGRLPRTEATKETRYAELWAKCHRRISKKRLLATVVIGPTPAPLPSESKAASA